MEKNQKLGQEPAFPPSRETQELAPKCFGYHVGMSKRFYAACAAMQGILAATYNKDGHNEVSETANECGYDSYDDFIITESYKLADELLKQEYEQL